MKKLNLLFIFILLFSCSDILENVVDNAVDNAIPDPDTLQISVKNSSTQYFTRIEINSPGGNTHLFTEIQSGLFSGFQVSNYSYSEAEIVVQTETGYYSFSPSNYDEETKVIKGRYYYDISIINSETISVIRKKF